MKFPVALQVYTVRNEMDRDYFGSLQKIAETGYQGVELSLPPAGISVSQVRDYLGQAGMKWVGCHAGYDALSNNIDGLLASLNEAGCKNLILSYLTYHSRQDVLDAAKKFNEFGKTCQAAGIQFFYHNHNHEFVQIEGERILDLLLKETDPALVKLEMDTYWVQRGGSDPTEYLRGLHGRCPLLHIKDMEAGPEQFFAEIGEGILNFGSILQEAQAAGVEWLIVEQDAGRRSPFDSIAISYRNLSKMGVL